MTGTMGRCLCFLWCLRLCDGELFPSKNHLGNNAKIHRIRTQNVCDMPLFLRNCNQPCKSAIYQTQGGFFFAS